MKFRDMVLPTGKFWPVPEPTGSFAPTGSGTNGMYRLTSRPTLGLGHRVEK